MGTLTVHRGSGSLVDPGLCQFRLSLVSGDPDYRPVSATPSATDTGTEVLTFAAAHGLATGTIIIVVTTAGGLTAFTRYWVRALSGTTIALYTGLADALSDSSRVDLTASITAALVPVGIEQSTLKAVPDGGGLLSLYNGSVWVTIDPGELSLGVTMGTSALPYDIFAALSGSSATLEELAWTSASARATALTRQDGVLVKSGDATRRYLGSVAGLNSGAVMDNWENAGINTAVCRGLYNAARPVPLSQEFVENTSHTYNSATPRQYNGAANVNLLFLLGEPQSVSYSLQIEAAADTDGRVPSVGFGSVTTAFLTVPNGLATYRTAWLPSQRIRAATAFRYSHPAGLHTVYINQSASAGVTSTFTSMIANVGYLG